MPLDISQIRWLTAQVRTLNTAHSTLLVKRRALEERIEKLTEEVETCKQRKGYAKDAIYIHLKGELLAALEELQHNIAESAKNAQQVFSRYEDFSTGEVSVRLSDVA